jgi:NAD(P)-dependent dehydrogenase (short-subunit alcohol dehydrogenase family)
MPNVLIIGPGGIGRAIAREQAARGWGITLLGRSSERLAAAAAECPGATTLVADPTDIDALPTCGPTLREQRPDGFNAVVCSVGSVLLQPAQRVSAAAWRAVLAANLDAAFAALKLAVELLPQGGSLLLFSSGAARLGLPNHEVIAAAKAGIEGLVRSAAASYARRNLRINAIAPGLTDTPLAAPLLASPAARKASEAFHALGRIGDPAQVARIAATLIDPANDGITGSIIAVDGGLGQCRT